MENKDIMDVSIKFESLYKENNIHFGKFFDIGIYAIIDISEGGTKHKILRYLYGEYLSGNEQDMANKIDFFNKSINDNKVKIRDIMEDGFRIGKSNLIGFRTRFSSEQYWEYSYVQDIGILFKETSTSVDIIYGTFFNSSHNEFRFTRFNRANDLTLGYLQKEILAKQDQLAFSEDLPVWDTIAPLLNEKCWKDIPIGKQNKMLIGILDNIAKNDRIKQGQYLNILLSDKKKQRDFRIEYN